MISMDVNHPDIEDFINVKRDLDKVTSANISVRTDDNFFMNVNERQEHVLNLIARNNWEMGEPGMLFWDKVQSWHLLSEHPGYVLWSTNPCGEQPLPENGSCLLGSLNLSQFVLNPFTDKARIDWEKLEKVTRIAVRGMNEVLDDGIPLHPLEGQRSRAEEFRQIGIGVLGLADLFVQMGVEYGSNQSVDLSHALGSIIRDTAFDESVNLAEEFGAYPMFNAKIVEKSAYFKSLPFGLQERIKKHGMRNSHVLSIAPTGSISAPYFSDKVA